MTDTRLRDLLHEAVADESVPDLSDTAWRSARVVRRRRTTGAVAAVVVTVVAAAVAVPLSRHGSDRSTPTDPASSVSPSAPTSSAVTPPDATVSPYLPGDGVPDAHFAGLPVWWSPALAQEAGLPAYQDAVLPTTIDLNSVVGDLVDHPLTRAVAAYGRYDASGSLENLEVLGPDGRLRTVDTSRVRPMADPEGNQRVRVGASVLSRSGEYLMFPQDHSLLVYTLRTGEWRTIDTGDAPTWDATWVGNTVIALADPARPSAQAPEYSIDGTTDGSGNVIASGLPDFRLRSSQIYGRARTGRNGIAQAFYPGEPIPQPPALGLSPGQSDWININGVDSGSAILLIPSEPGRQKGCCQVDGWIGPDTVLYDSSSSTGTRVLAWRVGTGTFWQVSRITGVTLGQESLVSSYAQFAAAGAPTLR